MCASALDYIPLMALKPHTVVSNPPFGKLRRDQAPDGISARNLHSAIVEVAMRVGETVALIMPASFADHESEEWREKYAEKLQLTAIDASYFQKEWRNTTPKVEVYSAVIQ